MQFTISTLFLIFFNLAASLALCGPWGLWISVVALLSALSLNRCKKLKEGIGYVLILVFLGFICTALVLPAESVGAQIIQAWQMHR